ncbi:hypothetical protein Adt_33331 [Abeliophyllum distichum]|uniref:Uncharacterized protein n=1 Tax=Abeliophyllum distichum TaxID=126358 RepID=A0ABD1QVY5_9LAMI
MSSMSAGILYASLSFVRSSSTIIEGTSKAAHLPTSALYGSSAPLKLGVTSIGIASPVLPSTPQIGSTPSIHGDTGGDASPPTCLMASPPGLTGDKSGKAAADNSRLETLKKVDLLSLEKQTRPLPQGLGHLAVCSFHGAQLRSRASPTGTRAPSSLLFLRSTTSLKSLFHWDSATLLLAPTTEHNLAQGPLPLGLSHLAACSSYRTQPRTRASPIGTWPHCSLPLPLGLSHIAACFSRGAQPRSRASPTGTRPHCSLLLPRSTAPLKGLSHWDSATLQLVPATEHNLAQGPLPLDSATLLLATPTVHSLAQGPLPLGLGYIAACLSHGS